MKKFIPFKKVTLLFSIVLIIALMLSITGCAPAQPAPASPTSTSTTAMETSSDSYPLVQAKTRFKIATTTSLYDTGLWYYLEPIFEKEANVELDIVYAGTGAALNHGRNGNVDAVIVHDPDQEKVFIEEGFGVNRRSFAYNFFMIAGPADDPAGIKGLTPAEAFKKIYDAGMQDADKVKFVSRGDGSGTHGAEKRLWASAGFKYEDIQKSGKWYIEAGGGMGPTLVMANQQNSYVLCDGSTFLSFKGKIDLVGLVTGASKATLNIYNTMAVSPEKVKTAKIELANKFINWLISPEVQKLVGTYGVKEFGSPLFNPITDGGCTFPACPNMDENMKPVQ